MGDRYWATLSKEVTSWRNIKLVCRQMQGRRSGVRSQYQAQRRILQIFLFFNFFATFFSFFLFFPFFCSNFMHFHLYIISLIFFNGVEEEKKEEKGDESGDTFYRWETDTGPPCRRK
eukprot:TRINITY_DN2276_c2_g1_i1.p1 TRINITY_DN2276_c2_g1~~TRINITY_DN2276_c2_g1_i1.p1  ORF type:complete len:117 (-),score=7.07 TRINITY_DN2276_c2_g1_i1:432-782(-)